MTVDGNPSGEPRRGRRRTGPSDRDLNALATELRLLRERSGMTLRELERHTYASDSALSRYLAGRALPPWEVVEALCRQGGGERPSCGAAGSRHATPAVRGGSRRGTHRSWTGRALLRPVPPRRISPPAGMISYWQRIRR
ncbi:helix-turn-helix domain-containing protein [Micromonospora sp. CPCC 206060]|uniref:helix-turn-helix domain-containing protein n=1 Tax=Micromonospora sp. CPCC 206060 TaxID=3122406 RepID=UPI003FA59D5A